MNDDDHDISRVPYFSTVCVYNESYSYATPLFTVALPDWQIPPRARHEGSIEMNSSTETSQIHCSSGTSLIVTYKIYKRKLRFSNGQHCAQMSVKCQ